MRFFVSAIKLKLFIETVFEFLFAIFISETETEKTLRRRLHELSINVNIRRRSCAVSVELYAIQFVIRSTATLSYSEIESI